MKSIEGEEGNFTVTITKSPRFVDMDKCIACGACTQKCPGKKPDEFDEGIIKRKAIYVPYPQAVPLKYAIDPEACLYLQKGKCGTCQKVCPTGAINYEDKEETMALNIGSVIVTTGFQAFNPSGLDQYQHGILPNVVTSLEFERYLSAGGPTAGHITRKSDGKEPEKIAWLQCVGSRDVNKCDNEYCSSVCCMYAVKEAVIAKEHLGRDFQPAIFFMDLRSHGKEFERYYNRAKADGVRFIRSRVHSITEIDDAGTLNLRYVTESGDIIDEAFDMVVLSVGMEASGSTAELAETLGIGLNKYRFVETDDLSPVAASKPGIYVAGVAQGCKDIPQSVMEASAAACSAGISLAAARGNLVQEKEFPAEKQIADEEPRIGVFVCNCGVNIGGIADVPAVVAYAKTLPGVTYAEENLFSCSQDTQNKMVEVIREQNLNRVVVAACTPRTHEPLFQETLRNSNLNPYLFEMANIRNQCTWVHSDNKEIATQKAKHLVKMSVARARLLEPVPELSVAVEKSALVIGGGVAGMDRGIESWQTRVFRPRLLKKQRSWEARPRDVKHTWQGKDVQAFLSDIVEKVQNHSNIDVILDAEITGTSGFVGNFETEVVAGGKATTVRHGAAVIATGGKAADTDEYLLGKHPGVTRWHDLEHNPDKLKAAQSVVFIQCVGSRDDNRPYCSRICCTASVKQALLAKELNPDADVYILYRDIRTFGDREVLYKEARDKGVIFYSLLAGEQAGCSGSGRTVWRSSFLTRSCSENWQSRRTSSIWRPRSFPMTMKNWRPCTSFP